MFSYLKLLQGSYEYLKSSVKVPKIYKEDYDISRNRKYKKDFNISLEDYNKMFEKQQGCCAICKKHQTEFEYHLAVDHCHKTGKIRSLLCSRCNVTLGTYENYKDICEQYLKDQDV